MQLFADTLLFIRDRSPLELFSLFWYFIVFDFSRYVLADTFFLAIHFWKRSRQDKARQLARTILFHENPLISVIAPGKNEGRHIPRLAESLHEQTYPNLELIIVDDGSDDNTPFILRELLRQGAITSYFRNDFRGGKASAANLALRYARGKFVVHLDADSHLRPDSIEQIIIPFYLDPQIGGVGGDIRVKNINESLATRLQAIDYMKSISTGRVVNSLMGITRIISGAYGAFRKDVLEQLKGWDVGPGLDGDITLRIRKLGYKVCHEPAAVCYTNVPNSFTALAKQRMRWDRSLVRFRVRRHADLFSLKNRNFELFNTLTAIDNVLFNMVLNFKWWIYLIQILVFNVHYLPTLLLINYCLYFLTNCLEFPLAIKLYGASTRRQERMLAFFLPLMPLYTGWFMRLVRTYAHLMELLHKASFDDKWNPWKVSRLEKNQGGPS